VYYQSSNGYLGYDTMVEYAFEVQHWHAKPRGPMNKIRQLHERIEQDATILTINRPQ
jgi:hypothetical protein